MTEELRIKVSVRNNRLLRAREEIGLSQKQASAQIGIRNGELCGLETCRLSPMNRLGWTDVATKVASFYGLSAEYLWPEVVRAVRINSVERCLTGDEVESVLALIANKRAIEAVRRNVGRLPSREMRAVAMKFGLDDDHEKTLDEIGEAIGVSRTRAAQVVSQGLQRLRKAFAKEGANASRT